jgi:hypothetical protein
MMLCRRVEIVPFECVVRGYLAGSGWREYQESGEVCGVPLPAGLEESSGCRSRSSRPRPRPSTASTTRTSPSRWSPTRVGRDGRGRAAGPRAGAVRGRRGPRRRARDPAGRHEVRVRAAGRRGGAGGRGADAGLLALLAGGPVGTRRDPAELRQAVRARLRHLDRLGQAARPRRRCPPEVVAATRARYVEAYERLTGTPRAGTRRLRRCRRAVRAAAAPASLAVLVAVVSAVRSQPAVAPVARRSSSRVSRLVPSGRRPRPRAATDWSSGASIRPAAVAA